MIMTIVREVGKGDLADLPRPLQIGFLYHQTPLFVN